jgi:hypothetical protein
MAASAVIALCAAQRAEKKAIALIAFFRLRLSLSL